MGGGEPQGWGRDDEQQRPTPAAGTVPNAAPHADPHLILPGDGYGWRHFTDEGTEARRGVGTCLWGGLGVGNQDTRPGGLTLALVLLRGAGWGGTPCRGPRIWC